MICYSLREPQLLGRVDAKLLQVMPKLQILLDKGNVTFNNNNNNNNNNYNNNNNKLKRYWLLNFLCATILDFMTALLRFFCLKQ